MAAYAARVGMEAFVFMPADTPIVNQHEAAYYGARAWLVDGLIGDCGAVVRDGTAEMGWFDVSTLREPYRIEGKKTMGLELAEQFDWSLPDAILYPTGGGTGLIGMWKAFAELAEIGWLADGRRPRMISCQSDGCAPISVAWEAGERFAEPFPNAATAASGLRVPAAVGDFMIIDAVNESGGQARACPEQSLLSWARRGAALEGIPFAPEAGACLGVLELLVAEKAIHPDERVVDIQHRRSTEVRRSHRARPPAPSTRAARLEHVPAVERTGQRASSMNALASLWPIAPADRGGAE